MRKTSLIFFCVLLFLLTAYASCGSDWQECSKFKKKKPSRWCGCGADNTSPTKPSHEEEYDPCDPFDPLVPDFSRPGQRISVTKCQEYIWQIKVRIERAERERQCKSNKGDIYLLAEKDMNLNNSFETSFQTPAIPHDSLFKNWTVLIMGGHDALPKEFPHMGAVGWKSAEPNIDWKFMCGSSLISPNFVLTAAHCMRADNRDTTITDVVPKIVRFGVEDIVSFAKDHSAEDRNISKIIPHPKYRSPIKYFDIALFQLDRKIILNKFVQPACLWPDDLEQVKSGSVTGWGVLNPNEHEGHPYLQKAKLDVIDTKLCEELLWSSHNRNWQGVQEHQFCAGQMPGGVDACQGDSGGPFQTKIPLPPQVARREGHMNYIVGVTSFGIGCGKKDIPGIYNKVSYFLDWIESIVWV